MQHKLDGRTTSRQLSPACRGAPPRFIYGAPKAAIIGMTNAAAVDYVTDRIRCNATCPGSVESPSLRERLTATGNFEKA